MNTFEIYQLKHEPENEKLHDLLFQPHSLGGDPDYDNYRLLYSDALDDMSLEGIYTKFNINRPHDFTGHSLSVSDVIVLTIDGIRTAHFVDTVGFVEVPCFLQKGKLND